MADHYAVLGIPRDAPYTSIKSAYNQLAIKTHPDKGGSSEAFIKVQKAYEELRDPINRAAYDKMNVRSSPKKASKDKSAQPANDHAAKQPFSPSASTSFPRPPPPAYTRPSTSATPEYTAWTNYRDPAAKPEPAPKPASPPRSRPSYRSHTSFYGFHNNTGPRAPDPVWGDSTGAYNVFPGRANPYTTPSSHQDPTPSATSGADEPPIEPTGEESVRSRFQSVLAADVSVTRVKGMQKALRDATTDEISNELWCHLGHFHTRLVNRSLQLQLRSAMETNVRLINTSMFNQLPAWNGDLVSQTVEGERQAVNQLQMIVWKITGAAEAIKRRKEDSEGMAGMDVDDDEVCRRLENAVHELKSFLVALLVVAPEDIGQGTSGAAA